MLYSQFIEKKYLKYNFHLKTVVRKQKSVSKKVLIVILLFLLIIFVAEVFFFSHDVFSSLSTKTVSSENTASETQSATGAVTLTIVAPPHEKD